MPFCPFFISLPMRDRRRLLLILDVTLALMDLGFFLPGTRLPRVLPMVGRGLVGRLDGMGVVVREGQRAMRYVTKKGMV